MGGTSWCDSHYKERMNLRAHTAKARGISTDDAAFDYDYKVRSGEVHAGVHKTLDPKGVTFRESRDSPAHPTALPIAVLLDITGSMRNVPRDVQANLPRLMGLLIRKGYAEHPAILIGAIGDATCDRAPLQVGQFESGIEIEDCLTNLFLEGGGGGHITESYELALYFMARHTVHDHHEKRGKRGYCFIIGDEIPYPKVKRAEVERLIGVQLDQDLPVADLLEELQRRYTVFFILPRMTANFSDERIQTHWRGLLGQNVLLLDDSQGICELIASQVGVCEGEVDTEDVSGELEEAGASKSVADAVSRALVVTGNPGGTHTRDLSRKIPDSGSPGDLTEF